MAAANVEQLLSSQLPASCKNKVVEAAWRANSGGARDVIEPICHRIFQSPGASATRLPRRFEAGQRAIPAAGEHFLAGGLSAHPTLPKKAVRTRCRRSGHRAPR
jgi:hypothetical protein